jgi:aspartyl/asparaginyl-tRNA synthetase
VPTASAAVGDVGQAERRYAGDLADASGQSVAVRGWVTAVQRKRDRVALTVRDHTGEVRCVSQDPAVLEALEPATPHSGVSVVGEVRPGRGEGVQLEIETVESLLAAAEPLPLKGNTAGAERLDYRYFDLRDPEKFAVFNIFASVESAIRGYLAEQGFISIHAPRITGGGSESGAAVFELPYFGDTACLVQSIQFYAQMAIGAGFDRVFDVGPVFRAENSVTNRHATEFTCLHVELAWVQSHEDLMALEEALIRHVLEEVADQHGDEIEQLFGLRVNRLDAPIPRIPFARAIELVADDDEPRAQLTARDERALSKYVHAELGHDFVFVTDFPGAERPFYTMAADGEVADGVSETHSFDLLWRGVEITSGCQREHRSERLYDQARADLGEAALEQYLGKYYLDMFNYGCPPHGGFGIGLDRFLMLLLGQPSLQETSFVFRGPERFTP